MEETKKLFMNEKLGVAVIGCGYWGVNYVRVFEELLESRVVVGCDARAERLKEIGRRFPSVALTTDLEEALQLPGVDAVIICTPATSHYEVARRCLAARKHILVEKPITTDPIEAEKLIVLAESKGLTLMVGHTFLYNAGIKRVKGYIEQAEVGQIYYLDARRTNLGPIRRDVNALWDLASHDVSIFNYLLDSVPEWVSAVGSKILNHCCEDVGFVSMGYPSGIIGHIHVSWANPNKVREVAVIGSNKRIVFDDLNTLERVRVYEKGVSLLSPEAASYGEYYQLRDGDIISPRVEVSEPLKNQCKHFIECVNHNYPPFSDGRAGLDVVRVMAAVDRSIEQNGVPVAVQSSQRASSSTVNGASVKSKIMSTM
jgi:predicted dehydrogenase